MARGLSDFGRRRADWLRVCDTAEAAAMLGTDRQGVRRLLRRYRVETWKDDRGRLLCWWLDVLGVVDAGHRRRP